MTMTTMTATGATAEISTARATEQENPLYAPPTVFEALMNLQESVLTCLQAVDSAHDAGRSNLRALRLAQRCLAVMTTLALRLPQERDGVLALLRVFIGATQWEMREAQAHAGDSLAILALRVAAQVQLTRLAVAHERTRGRHESPMPQSRQEPSAAPSTAPRAAANAASPSTPVLATRPVTAPLPSRHERRQAAHFARVRGP